MPSTTTQTLYQVDCDPACGFLTRNHNDAELIPIVIAHCLNSHQKALSEKDVRGFMKKL